MTWMKLSVSSLTSNFIGCSHIESLIFDKITSGEIFLHGQSVMIDIFAVYFYLTAKISIIKLCPWTINSPLVIFDQS